MQKNFYFKSTRKRAQSEIITTILIILVGIAAVAILSSFIINMVRNNLKGTDCFETMGEITINLENDWTYFNSTQKKVYINIERGTKGFNLTGFNLAYGNDAETKKVTIKKGQTTSNVFYLQGTTQNSVISIPDPGEARTYVIESSTLGFNEDVTKVVVAPIVNENLECEKSDEKTIPIRV